MENWRTIKEASNYEVYGYKATKSGNVQTNTPGTYPVKYTLTRIYSGDNGETITEVVNNEELSE